MSATLPNVADLATWLDAALYITQFRPIPLTEYLKINSSVYDAATMELKYNIQPIAKFKVAYSNALCFFKLLVLTYIIEKSFVLDGFSLNLYGISSNMD